MPLKVLGVAGSLRETSFSTQAVRLCLELAAERGADTRLMELRLTELPLYNPDASSADSVVEQVAEVVLWADAFVLGTPDYHGSMSGAMKNFLDYHWSEFSGKLFGYICASHEKGLTVMDQMRTSVRQCYGWSLPFGVSVHGEQDFSAAAGDVSNSRVAQRLRMLSRDLVVYGSLLREQFASDLAGRDPDGFVTRYAQ